MPELSPQDVRRISVFLERIAVAAERMATALEDANAADPLLAIERALGEGEPEPTQAASPAQDQTMMRPANVPEGVPESEWFRFR